MSSSVEFVDDDLDSLSLHQRVCRLEALLTIHAELLEKHLNVEPPRITMLKRNQQYNKQMEKKRRKIDSMKSKRFSTDESEILIDIEAGHEHLNPHGHFYDQSGRLCITIYMGTNCGFYWAVQCAGTYTEDENGTRFKEQDQQLVKQIQLTSPIGDDENVENSLRPMLTEALNQNLRYLMRYNNDGEKQYTKDIK